MRKLIVLLCLCALCLGISLSRAEEAPAAEVFMVEPWEYTFSEEEGAITLTAYKGAEEEVAIPETLVHAGQTTPVTALGYGAFRGNATLRSVYCPDTLLTIGEEAFRECGRLESVRLPAGLLKLEHYVFSQCYALASIELPETLTSIGFACFENCESLTGIRIPEPVATIRSDAFHGCTALETVEYDGLVSYFGGHVFSETPYLATLTDEFVVLGDRVLIRYNGSDPHVTVPSWIRQIADAFEDCAFLESVELPANLSTVGCYAFSGCTGLTEIIVPANVRTIEEYAFAGCTNLSGVTLGDSLTFIGENAFRNCRALTGIALPDYLITLESRAFMGCTRLAEIVLPVRLEVLGSSAFKDCKALTRAVLYQNIKKVSESTFEGVPGVNLEVVYDSIAEQFAIDYAVPYTYVEQQTDAYVYIRDAQGIVLRRYIGSEYEVYLPDAIDEVPVYAIGAGAFQEQPRITGVTFPDTIEHIGDWAFSWCTGLARVALPDRLLSIGSDAFRGCTGLTSIFLPDSIESVGINIFAQCEDLLILVDVNSQASQLLRAQGVPTLDALTEGGEWVFEKRDTGLWVNRYVGGEGDVTLPATYTGIPVVGILKGAFAGVQLSSLTIEADLEIIQTGAFAGMDGPADFYLSDGIERIEDGAFDAGAVLHAKTGTAAEAYARHSGNKFLVVHGR